MHKSDFSPDIFLKKIETSLQWEDLELSGTLLKCLEELQNYIKYGKLLVNNLELSKKIKPGFRVLFTGPSGKGKELTTALLGKSNNIEVYKVDLTQVVSKTIGETKKNLSVIFDKAKGKDWILYFDEADAIFGKRTNVNNANDRYSNQEASYFLQRIEDYNGVLILSSFLKSNIEESIYKGFQLVLNFEMPLQ